MQDSGAVFLPAAGWRDGINMYNVSIGGYYWTSSFYNTNGEAYQLYFEGTGFNTNHVYRYLGESVRLARDLTVIP
ncbi:MAG: hypothetical protein J6X62_04015 [Bacteroidales bacterium]|nr:hypothetical protein [Bacteroidales bacterium]